MCGNFRRYPDTFQIIWKMSRLSGIFPGYWKLSRLAGNFPDYPENIQILRKFQTIQKLSRQTGSFPVQFQGIRAKTFRSAMSIRRQGFSASVVLFIWALVISIWALALPLQAIVQLIRVLPSTSRTAAFPTLPDLLSSTTRPCCHNRLQPSGHSSHVFHNKWQILAFFRDLIWLQRRSFVPWPVATPKVHDPLLVFWFWLVWQI